MLSAADLASLRSTVTGSLPDTAEIHRRTVASDGAGGRTETWAPVATLPCRLGPTAAVTSQLVRSSSATEVEPAPRVITFAQGADVAELDRAFIGGVQFEIVDVLAPRTWELGRRAFCLEVEF